MRAPLGADPRFRAFALRHPLLRIAARRRAAELFALLSGFVGSQALLAFCELGLPDHLAAGPLTLAALAERVGVAPVRLAVLMEAARAARLCRRIPGGRYALAGRGAALVGNAGLRAMIAHDALLYRDLADPVTLLRGGGGEPTALAAFWRYDEAAGPAAGGPYSALMDRSGTMLSALLLDAWPFAHHRHVLDVGGGAGGLALALARHARGLRVTVLDLPPVAALAAARADAGGLGARIAAIGIDARRDPWPRDADLAVLCRVLHDHDDADAMRILRQARAALPPGGTLLVAEPMATEWGRPGPVDGYFGFYLLSMGSGRLRRPSVLRRMLRAAGFSRTRLLPTAVPLLLRVIAAS